MPRSFCEVLKKINEIKVSFPKKDKPRPRNQELISPVWFVPALTDLGISLDLIWAFWKRPRICSRELNCAGFLGDTQLVRIRVYDKQDDQQIFF
jgi:hypothetical protein